MNKNLKNSKENTIHVNFQLDFLNNHVRLFLREKLNFPNYLPAHLKYTDIQSSVLVETNQFVDSYTTLGYFETLSPQSLEIVNQLMDSSLLKEQVGWKPEKRMLDSIGEITRWYLDNF